MSHKQNEKKTNGNKILKNQKKKCNKRNEKRKGNKQKKKKENLKNKEKGSRKKKKEKNVWKKDQKRISGMRLGKTILRNATLILKNKQSMEHKQNEK